MDEINTTGTGMETGVAPATAEGQAAAAAADQTPVTAATEAAPKGFKAWLQGILNGEEGDEGGATGEQASDAEGTGSTFTQEQVQAQLAAARTEWEAERTGAEQAQNQSPEERIAQLENELQRGKLRDNALATLNEQEFPTGLADILDYSSEDAMQKSLATVTETFKGCLADAVKAKLRGPTPRGLGTKAASSQLQQGAADEAKALNAHRIVQG